jgi:hypothetical protein
LKRRRLSPYRRIKSEHPRDAVEGPATKAGRLRAVGTIEVTFSRFAGCRERKKPVIEKGQRYRAQRTVRYGSGSFLGSLV